LFLFHSPFFCSLLFLSSLSPHPFLFLTHAPARMRRPAPPPAPAASCAGHPAPSSTCPDRPWRRPARSSLAGHGGGPGGARSPLRRAPSSEGGGGGLRKVRRKNQGRRRPWRRPRRICMASTARSLARSPPASALRLFRPVNLPRVAAPPRPSSPSTVP
jgi:hypothetical protein